MHSLNIILYRNVRKMWLVYFFFQRSNTDYTWTIVKAQDCALYQVFWPEYVSRWLWLMSNRSHIHAQALIRASLTVEGSGCAICMPASSAPVHQQCLLGTNDRGWLVTMLHKRLQPLFIITSYFPACSRAWPLVERFFRMDMGWVDLSCACGCLGGQPD